MRIASLLPSATEIVCAIGLGDELVAVTHECDWPPEVLGTPVVTRAVHDLDGLPSREIHDRVTASMHGGSSLYALDEEAAGRSEARPHPHPGTLPRVRRELHRGQRGGPPDRCRHHRRLARTDVDRGHLPLDHDGRRDDRGRGRRRRSRRVAARAAEHRRARRRGAARRRPACGPGRRPRVAGPTVRRRALGAGADPACRRLGPARPRRRALRGDDLGRGPRRRSRDPVPDAMRLPPRRHGRGVAPDRTSRVVRRPARSAARRGRGPRWLLVLLASRARASSTGSSSWPR